MEKIPTAHEDLIVRHANLLPVPAEFRDRLTTPFAPAQPAGRCASPGCTKGAALAHTCAAAQSPLAACLAARRAARLLRQAPGHLLLGPHRQGL